MLYTTEEAAVICGFLNAHLAQHCVFPPFKKFSVNCALGVVKSSAERSPGIAHKFTC